MTHATDIGVVLASELASHPAVVAGHVLDLRPTGVFARGHLPGAMSWPVDGRPPSAAELMADLPSILLPARHEPLLVVAAELPLAREVAAHLHARGRARTDVCELATTAGMPAALLARGPSRPALWSPPPFLLRWAHLLPPPVSGPVLDLGCGSGRAAVWLARQGWRVTAVDHQREALAMGADLAAREGVAVDWRAADLRDPAALPAGPWSAVVMLRFLERPLVAALPPALAPGAVVVLRTFRDAPGYVGNPRQRHRLGPAEAARFWSSRATTCLVHEEDFDPDGKPAAGVVVRWAI